MFYILFELGNCADYRIFDEQSLIGWTQNYVNDFNEGTKINTLAEALYWIQQDGTLELHIEAAITRVQLNKLFEQQVNRYNLLEVINDKRIDAVRENRTGINIDLTLDDVSLLR